LVEARKEKDKIFEGIKIDYYFEENTFRWLILKLKTEKKPNMPTLLTKNVIQI